MGPMARLGALSASLALVLVAAGCGSDASEPGAATDPQPVVSGVVVDGPDGEPVEGVELELVVWPSPQVQGATEEAAPEPVHLGDAVSGADGSFEMVADPDDLTPHALTGGLVDLSVQVAGDPGPGTRASVVLGKEAGTGVTTLTPLEGLVVTMSPTAAGSAG